MRSLTDRLAEMSRPGPEEPQMAPLIDLLREDGVLAACAPADAGGADLAHNPPDPLRLAEFLAAVGAANLSAGRTFSPDVRRLWLRLR